MKNLASFTKLCTCENFSLNGITIEYYILENLNFPFLSCSPCIVLDDFPKVNKTITYFVDFTLFAFQLLALRITDESLG